MTNAEQFRLDSSRWNFTCKEALLRFENRSRQERGLSPLPLDTAIYLPRDPQSQMRMLNWKVWTLRYCVDLDFILSTLLLRYARQRRTSEKALVLGISLPTITGTAAREAIESAVQRAFPNAENVKAACSRVRNAYRNIVPVAALSCEDDDEALVRYSRIMRKRQITPDPKFRRPWRGNPWK